MRTSSRKPLQQMPHPPDSEHGIFLFLAAALVVVLISSVLFLGYFTIQSKRVNSLLRKNADLICQEIAYAPMLPERAWNTFQELVEKVDLKHGHITNARLVLPLMTNRVDNPPFCRTLDNQSLLTGSCGKGVNCTLETSVCDNNEHITSNYPSTIWDTARDIGSAVACELTAKMNPLGGGLFSDFFEDKVNETRVVWYRPLFYAQDEEFISTSETDNEYVWPNFPYGLTLIISPHMTTYGGLRRFQFNDNEDTLRFPESFLANHDPLKGGLSPFTSINPFLIYNKKTSIGESIYLPPFDNLFSDPEGLVSQKYDAGLAEREEMLVACRNPASLIRNIISATFVELASRDIRLRTSTDILLTGTAHRIWNSAVYPSNPLFFGGPTASFPSPPMPNSPILLVEKGQDLRAHAYQLPYVSFYGGVATPETYYSGELPFEPDNYIETAPLLGRAEIHHEDGYPDSFDLKQGWILPFATKTGEGKYNPLYARTLGQAEGEITENDRRLNALRNMITSQLRWCHHLYASEGGISLDPLSYLRTESYEEENEALEPPSYLNDSYLRESYPANDPWGPRCNPWIGCTSQNLNANAFELVMSLGTIQQCPFEMTFSEDEADPLIKHLRNSVSQPTCTKPPRRKEDEVDMPTKDLYPDFEGVFYFLHHPPPYQPIDGLELRNNARNDTPIVPPERQQANTIKFTIPLEKKKDDTSLEAILSTLQISFIPAVRSPALGIMREDFTHYSLANQIGAPFYPDPPHGNGPEENPLSLRDIDQINPLLPFSYHANDTLYVRRNLNSHHDLSPMVIVTHQLPDYNSLHRFLHQVSKLSTYTQAAPLSLIIIHIPTDLQEATTYKRIAKLISDFQDENIHVNLVSLSPFHPDGFSPNEIENTATDKVFKAYWKDLLDPSHPGNAIDLAEGLFFSLFDSPRQRF